MKNSIIQLTTVLFAFVALTFLVSFTRPAVEEPKEYMVIMVSISSHDKFEKEVSQKLAEGWHLQGGVAAVGSAFTQALVK